MRRKPAAVNAVVRPVVEYLPDHHGAVLASSLTAVTNSALNRARAVIVPYPMWQGPTQQQQQMTGAANLGGAKPITGAAAELNRQTTTTDPGASAIFASRMARR